MWCSGPAVEHQQHHWVEKIVHWPPAPTPTPAATTTAGTGAVVVDHTHTHTWEGDGSPRRRRGGARDANQRNGNSNSVDVGNGGGGAVPFSVVLAYFQIDSGGFGGHEEDELGILERVQNCLECPICFDLLRDPNETNCGHSFCEYCINKCLETSFLCPVCKKSATPVHPSFTLRKLVDLYKEINPDAENSATSRSSVASLKAAGNSAYNAKEYAKAIELYSAAIATKNSTPTSPAYRDPTLWSNRGQCYIKLRQYQRAIDDLRRCLELDPTCCKAMVRLALCQEALNMRTDCVETLRRCRVCDVAREFAAEVDACWARVIGGLGTSAPLPSSNNEQPRDQFWRTPQTQAPAQPQPHSSNRTSPPPPSQHTQSSQQPASSTATGTYAYTHPLGPNETNAHSTSPQRHSRRNREDGKECCLQ
ncbi:hypothetical protein Pelo_13016 [Pelomyxa schiedti]|nr:hypothetical protein Pelo_13016 [Pelomyxa schiedti]